MSDDPPRRVKSAARPTDGIGADRETLRALTAILSGQDALRKQIAALRAAIEGAKHRPLAKPDRERLVRLLPAIHAAVGSAEWSVVDLFCRAALPDDRAAVLSAQITRGQSTTSLKGFGKLVARGAGHDIGGLSVVRVGRDRCGAIWRVVSTVTLESHGHGCARAPLRRTLDAGTTDESLEE